MARRDLSTTWMKISAIINNEVFVQVDGTCYLFYTVCPAYTNGLFVWRANDQEVSDGICLLFGILFHRSRLSTYRGFLLTIFSDVVIFKVVTNEKQEESGRWQIIGNGLGLRWEMSLSFLIWPQSWINSVSFSGHSGWMNSHWPTD